MTESPSPYGRVRPPGKTKAAAPDFLAPEAKAPKAPVTFEDEVAIVVGKGKKFPCSRCGAEMGYKPGADALHCGYCGNTVEVPKSPEKIQELAFEKYFVQGKVSQEVLAGVVKETRCPGCGAMVMLPAHVKSEFCPFCSAQMTNPLVESEPIMAPGGILPFKISQEEALGIFRKWIAGLWFAPNALKRVSRLDRLKGLYTPYWTYDAMTFSVYSGQRGDDYYETVGSGKNRRTERRTRWRTVSGHIHHFFDDVTVCASFSVPKVQMNKLEPWDLPTMKPFNPDYMSGFATERYQVSARDGFEEAKIKMHTVIEQLVRQDIGGDHQRITSLHTQHESITFKYVLLPVWIAAYQFNKKTYQIFINASTGELHGDRPYDPWKIAGAVLLGLMIVGAVAWYSMGTGS